MKNDYQKLIFEEIKRNIEGKDSLGNVVGDILSISQDAVYRRYRGETLLTIYELEKLCKEFNISLDSLFDKEQNTAIFEYNPLSKHTFTMDSYLEDLRDSLQYIHAQNNSELILTVTNLPLLQLLNYPHLVRFKLFFWAKTYLQMEEYKDVKFSYDKISPKSFETGMEILKFYNQVPSKEIYNPELLRGLAREIYTNFQAHQFEDPTFALYLLEVMDRFVNHLHEQMKVGKKFSANTEPPASGCDFEVYINDTVNPGINVLYKSDAVKGVFIGHNVMSSLHTTDPAYLVDTENTLERQMNNSNLISIVNERDRNTFIFQLKNMIDSFRKRIQLELESY